MWQYSQQLSNELQVQWSIVTASGACVLQGAVPPADASIKVRAVLQRSNAWLSVGWNTNGNMVGTDSILGLPGAGAVRDTHLTLRSLSGVATDGTQDVVETGISSTGGETVMAFTRRLSTGDSNDFNLLPAASAVGTQVTWVWAHGGSQASALAYHQARGSTRAALVTAAPVLPCPDGQARNTQGDCEAAPGASALLDIVFLPAAATSAGAAGSDARTAFVQQVAADVELALGLVSQATTAPVSGRVRVTAVVTAASGALNVTVALLPAAEAGSALNAATGANRTASVPSLAAALASQLASPGSPLYSGVATRNVDASAAGNVRASVRFAGTPPRSVLAPPAGCETYPFSGSMDGSMSFIWAIVSAQGDCIDSTTQAIPDDAALKMQVRLARDAWLGIGFNSEARMVGSDGVAAYPPSTVRDIGLTARSVSGVSADARQDVSNTAVVQIGGDTLMNFTRPLRTGDSDDFDLLTPTQADESIVMIWARGSEGQRSNSIHSRADRGSLQVALASGAVSDTEGGALELAHGVLMTIAWCVMVPLGVMAALRIRPRGQPACCGMLPAATASDDSKPQTWYVWHWRFQMSAFLLAVIAFVLALVFVGPDGPTSTHAYIGIAVFALMTVHVLAALVRPGVPAAGETPTCLRRVWSGGHLVLGRGLPLLAFVAVLSGWALHGVAIGGAVAIPLATTLLVLVASFYGLPSLLPDIGGARTAKPVAIAGKPSATVSTSGTTDVNPMYA